VVGPTKSGKSVLITQLVQDPVSIDGQDLSSLSAMWQVIGYALNVELDAEGESRHAFTTTAEGKAKALIFEGGGGVQSTSEESATSQRVIAISSAVRSALLTSNRVVVIEDFHFVSREVQGAVIRALKQLVFKGLIVIVTAISHRRHDAAAAVDDMGGRLATVEIPVWNASELKAIAADGFSALNVFDAGGFLGEKLAAASFGSPQIMQRLCRALVRDVNGVAARPEIGIDLSAPQDWDDFFRGQVSQDSVRWFRKLLKGPLVKGQSRTKWSLREGGTLDTYGVLLAALVASDPTLEVTTESLRAQISALLTGDSPSLNQVTGSLKHMSRIAAKRLGEPAPTEEELDADDAGDYVGVQPVIEFVEDGALSVLHIADPFFAYFVQWGSAQELEKAAESPAVS
jgi:hypothetical protein